jgi:hypothetical protein
MTLNLYGEEMPTRATTLEGAGTVVSPVPLDMVVLMALVIIRPFCSLWMGVD